MENPRIINRLILYAGIMLAIAAATLSAYLQTIYPLVGLLLFVTMMLGVSLLHVLVLGPFLFLLSRLFGEENSATNSHPGHHQGSPEIENTEHSNAN